MAIVVIDVLLQMQVSAGRLQTVSVQVPTNGDSVGVYCNADQNQPATSTSPEEFVLSESASVYDIVVDEVDTATGMLELVANGKDTQFFLNIASHYRDSVGRPKVPMTLVKGVQYRLKVVSACANA